MHRSMIVPLHYLTHCNIGYHNMTMREQRADWLTTPEAAAYMRVHIETMRRWAREGSIPSVKLGNRGGFRFRQLDLDAFLAQRLRPAVPPGK